MVVMLRFTIPDTMVDLFPFPLLPVWLISPLAYNNVTIFTIRHSAFEKTSIRKSLLDMESDLIQQSVPPTRPNAFHGAASYINHGGLYWSFTLR